MNINEIKGAIDELPPHRVIEVLRHAADQFDNSASPLLADAIDEFEHFALAEADHSMWDAGPLTEIASRLPYGRQ